MNRGLAICLAFFLSCAVACTSANKQAEEATGEAGPEISSKALELESKTAPVPAPTPTPAPTPAPTPPPAEPTAPIEKLTSKDFGLETQVPTPPAQPSTPPQPSPTVPFQPQPITNALSVALVLDASGSMNGLFGTETKWSALKNLLGDLAKEWSQLSIVTLGAETPLEENNCQDIQAPIPFSAEAIAKIEPKGMSPIAGALQKAGEQLQSQTTDRLILLVADGKDNCGGDPCAIAQKLYAEQKIITHVVAFDTAPEDESLLRCIAENGHGVFSLARTREELASALHEAAQSAVPYNLRIKTAVGATPLPTTITVYVSNSQQVVKQDKSFGTALLRLPAGSYDILVEYSDSIALQKPSKMIKGVELSERGKVEQEIRFSLASVTLSAHDAKGNPAETQFQIYKTGENAKIAEALSDGNEATYFIEPGNYDLVALARDPNAKNMALKEPGVNITVEEGFIKHFAFQTGTLVLKGQTPKQEAIPFHYLITRPGENLPLQEGDFEASGGTIELPPGLYDIHIVGQDPNVKIQPHGVLKDVPMEGGSIIEKVATLAIGVLTVEVQKPDGSALPSWIHIQTVKEKQGVATLEAKEGKGEVGLAPGSYDLEVNLLSPLYLAPPSVKKEGITIKEGEATTEKVVFDLGTFKVLGRNTKESPMQASYAIYKGGTLELFAQSEPQKGWVSFDLPPGNYDVKVEDVESPPETRSVVWQRDVIITSNTTVAREAVFTNAKLRLIGRGTNNEIIPVQYKLYEYGHDRPLLSGATGNDWNTLDLLPGSYYIEASYRDSASAQILKKWVTVKVAENEWVERELRF